MEHINIFNISISSYAFFIFFSFFSGLLVIIKLEKDKEKDSIILLYLINIIGFIIGAKSLYFIEHKSVSYLESGYTFTGGLIGSMIVLFIYSKINRKNIDLVLNNYSVIYLLIYGIAKIGCYFGGCCSGYTMFNNIPLQLFEAIITISLFFILFLLVLKKKYKVNYFFILFSTYRFIIDYFRYNRNIIFYNVTYTQIICIIFLIISLVNLIQSKRIKNN